jgi:hypothetical protein
VSLRDKSGAEKHVIERSAPVWSLQWNPSREEQHDLLAVACWDQTLSFYESNGAQFGKDKVLAFDPCCVRHFSNGKPAPIQTPHAALLTRPSPPFTYSPKLLTSKFSFLRHAATPPHSPPRASQANTFAWAARTARRRCGPRRV